MNEYEVSGIENIARGVCVVEGKVLLCRPKNGNYTYLPGGHIEFGEKGREALVREIKEEMGLDSEAGDLLGVVESQFRQHGKPHAEINLIYRLTLIPPAGSTARLLDLSTSLEDWIAFEWRDLDDLGNANLLPPEMIPYIKA